ncbi:MAG: DUF4290 domain-containing protein [Bacteroidota bacterium]
MKYNVSETPLRLREFGRNVQSMVEYALTIEDMEKRTQIAHEIVRIMGNLNPQLKEIPEYKQKLWDALYLVSDRKLDVEGPFPVPELPEPVHLSRERLPYMKGQPRYKQYGRNVQLMIEKATHMEEGELKKAYINQIANTMQQFLRNMDRESAADVVITEHIRDISDGKLKINPEDLVFTKTTPPPEQNRNHHSNNKKKKKSNRNKNNRRRKNNHNHH